MATSVLKEALREKFEQGLGSFGDVLREARLKKERAERTKKRVEYIEEVTTQLRTTRASLSSIEKHFILISKNVQILAQAMGAQVTLQEETDKVLKEIDDLRKKKKKIKISPSSVKKVNQQLKEDNDDVGGFFDNILNLFGRRGKPRKGPPKRTPRRPPRRPPGRPPGGRPVPKPPGRRRGPTPAQTERRARAAARRAYNRAIRNGASPQEARRISNRVLQQSRTRGQAGVGRGPSAQQAARQAAIDRENARRQAALDAEQRKLQAEQRKLTAEKAAAEERYKKLKAEAEARANAIEEQRKKVAAQQAEEQKRIKTEQQKVEAEQKRLQTERAAVDADRRNIETERARVQAAQADVETQRARLNADTAKAEQVSKAAATANEARAAQLKIEIDALEKQRQEFGKLRDTFDKSYVERSAELRRQEKLADERLKAAATEAERVNAERAKVEAEKARIANDADYKRVNAEYASEARRLALAQAVRESESKRITPAPEAPKPPTPTPSPSPEPPKPLTPPPAAPTPEPTRITAPPVQQTRVVAPIGNEAKKAISIIARNKLARAAGAAVAKKLPFIGLAVGLGFAAWELVRGQITQAAISIGETFDPTLFGVTAVTLLPRIRLETYEEHFGVDPNIDPENPGGMISGPRWLEVVKIVDEEWELLKQQMKDSWNKSKEEILSSWKNDYELIKKIGFASWLKQSSINVNAPTARERRAQRRSQQQQQLINTQPPDEYYTPPVNPPSPINLAPLSGITSDDKPIMAMIMDHEGVRNTPYKDSQGLWTIGVGHLIGDGRSLPPQWNRQFSDDEVMALFAKDYLKHKAGAVRGPGYDKANQTGRAALIDLAFNMGNNWYIKFPKATAALKAGDFDTASVEMIDSDWYKQVGRRAPKIVSMIKSGTDISMNTIVPQQNETGTQLAQASTAVNAAKQKPTVSPTIIVAHNTTQALAASSGPQGRAEFIGAVGA